MKKVKIQKEVTKVTNLQDKKVSVEELKKLNALENQRNTLAFNIGVATYNWQNSVDEFRTQLEKAITEQKQLGELILSLYGCDAKKQNFKIDLTTGLISIV